MHLSIGQEASAVGSILALNADDYILSTHRGHGHCIAKGADPARMLAEFFGKETGYCRGRGGSMHIADLEGGNLGANGIVAGGLPIAVGVGMSIKAQKQDRVCMVFFGDGAANEGAFHEALNMASIWKLPVVFVCENNKYAMSMDIALAMAVRKRRRPRRRLRNARHRGGRQRPARRRGRVARRGCPRAQRRRTVARRMQDVSPARAFEKRSQPVSHQGRDRRVAQARSDRPPGNRAGRGWPVHARRVERHREGGADSSIENALEFAKASPDPDPAQLTRDVYAG